jgi:biopolymer transport protein TolR
MVSEINMVPFIDIMLVLLVVFMLAAPTMVPSSIELPSVGQTLAKKNGAVIQVIIHADRSIALIKNYQEIPLSLDQLASQILQPQRSGHDTPHPSVVIAADREVKYEQVIQVMDKLHQAGIQKLGLSVVEKRPPSRTSP